MQAVNKYCTGKEWMNWMYLKLKLKLARLHPLRARASVRLMGWANPQEPWMYLNRCKYYTQNNINLNIFSTAPPTFVGVALPVWATLQTGMWSASRSGCFVSVGKTLSQPHMDTVAKKICHFPCHGLNPSHPAHSHHYTTLSQLSIII
jgi:hypothetical protein